MVFPARIFYLNIATIAATIFVVITNIVFTKQLLPEIKFTTKYFQFNAVIELIKSGIWNVLNRLSQVLETGLDLLLANIFLGASLTGTLSISKIIPNSFIAFTFAMVNAIAPQLTISYSKNNTSEVVKVVKQSIKIMTFFTSLFFSFIVVYSKEFYKLWIPSEDANLLYVLTVLAVFHMPVTSGMNSLYNIFTVTNKIKKSCLVLMANSVLNAIIIIAAVNLLQPNYSIYFVAGISSFLAIVIVVIFVIPYAGICLKLKKGTFFPDLMICLVGNVLMLFTFLLIKSIFVPNSWMEMFMSLIISGIFGSLVYLYVLINKDERKFIINKILRSNK